MLDLERLNALRAELVAGREQTITNLHRLNGAVAFCDSLLAEMNDAAPLRAVSNDEGNEVSCPTSA